MHLRELLRSDTDGMLLYVPSTHRCFAAGDNAFSVYSLRCGTISLFQSGNSSHKQLLKEILKVKFSIFITEHEFFPTLI